MFSVAGTKIRGFRFVARSRVYIKENFKTRSSMGFCVPSCLWNLKRSELHDVDTTPHF